MRFIEIKKVNQESVLINVDKITHITKKLFDQNVSYIVLDKNNIVPTNETYEEILNKIRKATEI